MHLFYAPGFDLIGEYELSEEESRHTSKVLRLTTGANVLVTDGRGTMANAVLLEAKSKKIPLRIVGTQLEFGRRSVGLHLAIAPPKNPDRLEWLLEKATEIGIEEITPLWCARSEKKDVNVPRLERILVSAMKQSIKAYLPVMHELARFADFVEQANESKKYIAHCLDGTQPFKTDSFAAGTSVLVLVGPEGDFSPEEIRKAIDKGFAPLSLGNARLRTETAGVVVCAQHAFLYNEHQA